MIDPSNIIDNMEPIEFRFNKNEEFSESKLHLPNREGQYLIVKQVINKEKNEKELFYYIIYNETEVIGRFDVAVELDIFNSAGITYHIIENFQNKGIGQTTLEYVVEDIFTKYRVKNIRILAINDRSRAIALKNGFSKKSPKSETVFELKLEDYEDNKNKDIDDER